MTTLIEDIEAILAPCVPVGRAWHASNRAGMRVLTGDGTEAPYIVWQRIVSTDNVNLSGPSDLQNTRLQVDIFAPRISDAEAVRVAVDAAMQTSALTVIPLSSQDLYEPAVKLARILRQYSIWR